MAAGSNKFGNFFQWTSFGESHGAAMGVVIDGCPAGVEFDEELLLKSLAKRRPGGTPGATTRNEKDEPKILSGIFEGKTLGTPIAVTIANESQRSKDYDGIKDQYRIGHADDLWQQKFGHRDHRGGGRASARETVNWVIAGAFAQMFVEQMHPEVKVSAKLHSVAGKKFNDPMNEELQVLLAQAQEQGESFGAQITLQAFAVPALLGEPVFKKVKAELSHAFMTINACVGVELGEGWTISQAKGSEVHTASDSEVYGGIRGGITTGETLQFRLAFKPTSSIHKVAQSGRHDPCVALRALPIVEAMTWNVLADLCLARRLNQL